MAKFRARTVPDALELQGPRWDGATHRGVSAVEYTARFHQKVQGEGHRN